MYRQILYRTVLVTVVMFTAALRGAERPNIIFLMADDQSTYSMGCYNTPGANTPNLDQLAAEGIVFDAHYDTTAICMASRATVMTGMLEFRTGCNFDHGPLLQRHWSATYPVLLREAGYITAFAGKFGFEVTDQPGKKGILPEQDFDRWGGGPGQTSYDTKKNASMKQYADRYPHSTLSYGAFGRDFIRDTVTTGKPFCLSISFKAPHHPVQPDPKFDDVFANMKFSPPGNYGRQFGEHFSRQSRMGRQYERFHSWKYSTDYDAVIGTYFQQIYAIDAAVGIIRQAVEAAGVRDNTVIIYTSDNGFLNGAHGYGSKVLPYEEASRVPLIVMDPRHSNSGRKLRCAALTGNVDFAPTILDLAGLPAPDHMDGRSLMPLYDDPTNEIHKSLPLINVWGPREVHSLAVVTRSSKYIYWPWAEGDFEAAEEMYDYTNDRLELENLVASTKHSTQLMELQAMYDHWVRIWNRDAVEYHNYKAFGTVFDRAISWSQKRKHYTAKRR